MQYLLADKSFAHPGLLRGSSGRLPRPSSGRSAVLMLSVPRVGVRKGCVSRLAHRPQRRTAPRRGLLTSEELHGCLPSSTPLPTSWAFASACRHDSTDSSDGRPRSHKRSAEPALLTEAHQGLPFQRHPTEGMDVSATHDAWARDVFWMELEHLE